MPHAVKERRHARALLSLAFPFPAIPFLHPIHPFGLPRSTHHSNTEIRPHPQSDSSSWMACLVSAHCDWSKSVALQKGDVSPCDTGPSENIPHICPLICSYLLLILQQQWSLFAMSITHLMDDRGSLWLHFTHRSVSINSKSFALFSLNSSNRFRIQSVMTSSALSSYRVMTREGPTWMALRIRLSIELGRSNSKP